MLAVPAQIAPDQDDILEHILFALKHEGTNLQVLAQSMHFVPVERLRSLLDSSYSSRYVRLLCYLWEAFMEQHLVDKPLVGGTYAQVFNSDKYITGPAYNDPRWRVSFNGLGTLSYCATVERTAYITRAIESNILGRTCTFFENLQPSLQERTLDWAYLHETESSYSIEYKNLKQEKTKAFVELLKTAYIGLPLTERYLCELQSSIVTNPVDRATHFRDEQNWLRGPGRGAMSVTYVPPSPELLKQLMSEWMDFANHTAKQIDPIVAASITSFGFVFLHPFMDGNGRLSRFLFHRALCSSGQLFNGQILPISVAMKRNEVQYMEVLQNYSSQVRDRVQVTWLDYEKFDFNFKADDTIFRYWDATRCVEFGFQMAEQALDLDLKKESDFLTYFDTVVRRVNEQIDIRNNDLVSLTAICLDNQGVIPKEARKNFISRVPFEAFDILESVAKYELATSGTMQSKSKS
jgi:hypothetical protein